MHSLLEERWELDLKREVGIGSKLRTQVSGNA